MEEAQLLKRLDDLVATLKASVIPLDMRWLDADGVGALLSYAPRYVLENLSCRPDFPEPLRLDAKGHPRWHAKDIMEWAQSRRDRKRRV